MHFSDAANKYASERLSLIDKLTGNLKIRTRILGLFLIIITISVAAVAATTYYFGKNTLEGIVTNQLNNSVRFVTDQITLLTGAYTSREFSDKLSYVLTEEQASFKQAGLDAKIYLINSSGLEIDRSNVNAETSQKTDLPGDFAVKAMKGRKGNMEIEIAGSPKSVSYGYIIEKDWIYVVAVSKSSYLQFIYKLQISAVVVGSISILLAFLFSFIGTRGIINTIKELNKAVSTAGTGNLAVRAKAKHGGPEMKHLADNFNMMLSNFEGLLREIGNSIEKSTLSSGELTSIAEKSDESTAYICSLTQKIAEGSEEQKNFLVEINKSTDKIIGTVQNIMIQINDAAQLSDTMMDSVNDGISNIKQLSRKITDMEEVSNDTVSHINLLESHSAEIYKIADTIRGISNQTKLLSLNASIEAARAGEHGVGFAVVAQEIQKLAQSSSKSAYDVGEIIKEIRKSTDAVLEIACHSKLISHEGVEIANETDNAFSMILSKVTKAHDYISHVSTSTTSMSSDMNLFVGNIGSVEQIITSMAASFQEIAAVVEGHHNLSSCITSSARNLLDMAHKLKKLKEKFITK